MYVLLLISLYAILYWYYNFFLFKINDNISTITDVKAIVPPGAKSNREARSKPLKTSITPIIIEIIRDLVNPFLNCMAVAAGITIIDEITSIPITLIETEIVAPTMIVKI